MESIKHLILAAVVIFIGGIATAVWADSSTTQPTKELTLDLGNGVTMNLVLIPAGRFLMGSPDTETDHFPTEIQHEVTLSKPFFMGVTHVTVDQFATFVKDSGYKTDAEKDGWSNAIEIKDGLPSLEKVDGCSWRNPGFDQKGDYPVVEVSWNDAQVFCGWLSRKSGKTVVLPTEAQWEYACRAGTKTAYPWGDSPDDGKGWANCADQSLKKKLPEVEAMFVDQKFFGWDDGFVFTSPVGRFKANAFGLYDMIGNASQRCSDRYEDHDKSAVIDPTGPENGALRVVRGGSWIDFPQCCRSAFRNGMAPDDRANRNGFRVAGVAAAGGFGLAGLAFGAAASQPSTSDPAYAANLYAFAANGITVDSPFEYDFDSPPYPPDSQEWRTREKAAFDAGVDIRNVVARARGIQDTQWSDDPSYLNPCRKLAVNLGDAALYLDWQGEHAQAVQLVRDILQLADLLEEKRPSDKFLVRVLVGGGIRMIAAVRLQQIASGVPLTKDPSNPRDLQFGAAHDLIAQLLKARKPIELLSDVFGGPSDSPGWRVQGRQLNQKLIETFGRVKAECTFAAISLACHMYKSDHGHWPESLNEMVPDYLPFAPPDPWSDENASFGYIIIKGALPDGSDRPLIYCRCNSPDGMFYRVDRPQYSYYNDDGSNLPGIEQKHGGQFRDIIRWQPPANPPGPSIPTTAPATSTAPSK